MTFIDAVTPTGFLQICKVAGTGITVGTNFTFDVAGTPVIVPAGPAPGGSCGTAVTVPAGTAVITETIPAGTVLAGVSTSPAGLLVSSNLGTGTATVTVNAGAQTTVTFINRTVLTPPSVSKAFGATSLPLNGTTSLSFTLNNPNTSTTLTGIGFLDTLPGGLVISTPNGLTGSCGGGTITATQGTNVISLSGAVLSASSSCTFSVNVTGTAAGTQNNTTGAVTSTNGGAGNAATASVIVQSVSVPMMTEWGEIMLTVLLVGSVIYLRRRRSAI